MIPTKVATSLYGIAPIIQTIVSPFGGKLLDRYGRKGSFMFFQCFMGFFCCIIFIVLIRKDYTSPNYYFIVPLVIQSVAQSIPVPSSTLTMIVEPNALGTAFGLTACFMNLCNTVVPLGVGAIITDKPTLTKPHCGYTYEQLLLLGIIFLASVLALACLLDDRYNRGTNIERDPKSKVRNKDVLELSFTKE